MALCDVKKKCSQQTQTIWWRYWKKGYLILFMLYKTYWLCFSENNLIKLCPLAPLERLCRNLHDMTAYAPLKVNKKCNVLWCCVMSALASRKTAGDRECSAFKYCMKVGCTSFIHSVQCCFGANWKKRKSLVSTFSSENCQVKPGQKNELTFNSINCIKETTWQQNRGKITATDLKLQETDLKCAERDFLSSCSCTKHLTAMKHREVFLGKQSVISKVEQLWTAPPLP